VRGGGAMKKHNILLALPEEDPHSPIILASALEDEGYQVARVASGEAAIEKLHENHFDLVITDLLPILEEAKTVDPRTRSILVLTPSCESIPAGDAIRSPADEYLFKPFELTELEIRVADCMRESDFKHANAQLESSEIVPDQKILNMLKIMSHDIRGSLLSLSATLKLLNRGHYGKMDEGVADRLKELSSKTDSLIGMSEEYLSRALSMDEEIEREEKILDLMQDVINPVLQELSPELKDHRLLIDNSFTARRISIRAGWIWVKTIFRNLLKNAIKYGEKGCTIFLGFEDRGSSYQLNIYNSGNPIPEEYRDNLFSEFMQIGNRGEGNGDPEGMGLGLHLIKKILQKQGGDIWYEARKDGSNFVFTFPSETVPPVNALLTKTSAQLQWSPEPHGGKARGSLETPTRGEHPAPEDLFAHG
jgi:signal transduction histidine kinase